MALTPEQINDYVSNLFNDPMGEVYRLAKFETEARSRIDKLQGDVKYVCQQRDHFGTELGKYQKELVEVRQRRDQLGIENAELHGQLRNRDTVTNALNDRITELEGENQNLLRRIGELRNSSTYKLQQENEQLRKENEELRNSSEREVERVKDEAARVVQSISESSGAWAAARLQDLENKLSLVEQERDRLANNVTDRDSWVKELRDRVKELKAKNEALKKGNEEPPTTSTEEKGTVTIEAWLVGHAVDRLRLVWATEEYVKALHYAITKRASEANFVGDEPYFAPVKVTL